MNYEGDELPESIGSYPVQQFLGRGGMSEVYEGWDQEASRRVALKVLNPELVRDPDATRRLEREAEILEILKHPYIAELYGVGQTEDHRPFLVCELIQGRLLQDYLEDRVPIDHGLAMRWMTQAAEALSEAWKRHIIHRDLKPANMMIDHDQNLKLLDFGLAKALYDENDQSKDRIMLGTPRYISPEMGRGQSLDCRADMYSLGATFYHVFVGQTPFDAETAMGLIAKHAQAPLPPPQSIDPDLPQDICDMLTHLLEKDPAKRYQDYSDLIGDLREATLALQSGGQQPPDANQPNPIESWNPQAELGEPEPDPPDEHGLSDLMPKAIEREFVPKVPAEERKIELAPMQARPELLEASDPEPTTGSGIKNLLMILIALGGIIVVGVMWYHRTFIDPPEEGEMREGWFSTLMPGAGSDETDPNGDEDFGF